MDPDASPTSRPAAVAHRAAAAPALEVAAELTRVLDEYHSLAHSTDFRRSLVKRAHRWVHRTSRLVRRIEEGASLAAHPSLTTASTAFGALRGAGYDFIQNCDWMDELDRHEVRKLVDSIPEVPNSDADAARDPVHAVLPSLMRRVSLIEFKVTMGCNLPCTYCNMDAQKPTARRMDLSLYRDAVELLMRSTTVRRPEVEFHGGEPLLLRDDWFVEAVEIAEALAKKHDKSVVFRMVTNGLLLSDERIDRLCGLGIELCLSLDGPPDINDAHRGGGQLVEAAIRRLKAKGIPFATLMVISDANVLKMREVLDYFEGLGLTQIKSCFTQPQGRAIGNEELPLEQKLEAMRVLFTNMASDHPVRDDHVEHLIKRMTVGRAPRTALACSQKECIAGRSFITVDPAGDLFACATDLQNHRLGNLYQGVERDHANRTLVRLHEKDDWYDRCQECAAKQICDFNCPTSHHNDPRYRDEECAYTKAVYAYLDAHRDIVDDIAARIAADALERGKRRAPVLEATPGKRVRRLNVL